MADMILRMTGEAQAVIQQLGQVRRAQETLEQKLRDFGTTSQKVGQEERELNRMREQVLRQIQTPQEQYNQKVGQLDRLLKANKLSQDQYNRAVAQSKQEMDRAGESGQKAFGPMALGMTRQLIGALGITGGVAGAIQLVRAEYQALIEAQREAAQTSLTLAESQEQALLNLGATSKQEIDEYLAAVSTMSQRVGVTERSIHMRASDALSARGDLPWQAALGAVEASFQAAPIGDSAGRFLAGAALDLGRAGGMGQEEALGFLQQVGTMARVTSTQKIAEEVPRAVTAAAMRGGSAETGAALFAAITQASGDPSGEISRTAVINFIDKLSEFEFAGAAPANLEERIARMQTDPAARQQFLAEGGFAGRGATKAAVEQIVAGGGAADMFAEFRQRLVDQAPERAGLFREGAEARAGVGAQRVHALSRELSGVRERAATADLARGGEGAMREQYWQIMTQAGVGRFEQNLDWLRMGSGMEGFEQLARHKAAEFGPGGYRRPQGEEAAAQTHQVLVELADAIAKLREAAEEQKQAAGALNRGVRGGETLAPPNPQGDR